MIIHGCGNIEAEVILASQSGYTNIPPIYTIRVRFPRSLLPAFSKHTLLRFNGVSNRAVKTLKAIEDVRANPWVPIDFGGQQKGMSGNPDFTTLVTEEDCSNGYQLCLESPEGNQGLTPEQAWLDCMNWVTAYAEAMAKSGLHQETVSRLLEPFQMTELIITATCWDNFFNLRLHKDAQGSFNELARVMKEAMSGATVRPLINGWHLPMLTEEEALSMSPEDACKLSSARTAVISYNTHRGEPMTLEKGLKLYNHLVSDPKALHLSPLEHQARPLSLEEYVCVQRAEEFVLASSMGEGMKRRRIQQLMYHGSYKGWVSHRFEEEAEHLS